MFQHIVLRRTEKGSPVSAGQIAEALLYYQKVHLFIDRGTLFSLIRQVGPKQVLNLLKRHDFSAVYCEEFLGTKTDSVGVTQYHDLVAFTLAGHEGVGELKTPRERLQYELERQGLFKSQLKAFVNDFLKLVPIRKFSGDYFLKGGIPDVAKRDVLDTDYVQRAISKAVSVISGGYEIGDSLKVELINTDKGVVIFTNIDFERIRIVPYLPRSLSR